VLAKLIELWPGGPALPLGDYLVDFTLIFSMLTVVLAAALGGSRRGWLTVGTLALASLTLAAFQIPLARPYGLVDGSPVLEDAGHLTVTAAGGAGSDGRLVDQDTPHPLWGVLVAAVTAFDVERLWRWYPWIPWAALVLLGSGVWFMLGGVEPHPGLSRSTLSGLGVFFVSFLSAHRLSFTDAGSTFWEAAFWNAPHAAVALAAMCLSLRWLSDDRWRSQLIATAALAVAGWLEPRAATLFVVGALAWAAASRRFQALVATAAAALLYLPFRRGVSPAAIPNELGRWHDIVDRVFSVTVDAGLVFVLAAIGAAILWRSHRAAERLLATTTATGLVAWVFVSSSPAAARLLHPDIVSVYVRLWLAVSASYGAYRGLAAMDEGLPGLAERLRDLPGALHQLSVARIGLAGFVLASIPWCFPYWWMPVRMDPTWVASAEPISGNLFEMSRSIRETTEPDAVFVAGASYAPWIPALSGRRVLVADTEPDDVATRRAAQQAFAFSNDAETIRVAADRYQLTHLAWGRLDRPAVDFTYLETSPLFVERYRLRRWVRIFEYRGASE
jgi:hypothetical protein